MGRRNKHDVFVIGEELSSPETTVLEDPAAPADDQAPGGHSQPPGLGHRSALRRRRVFAALAIAGPTATAIGVLISSLSTSGAPKDKRTSSSRSVPVQRPAPGAALPPAQASRHLPGPRRPEPSHGQPAAARRSQTTAQEPERESTPPKAPESSQLPVSSPPVPEAPAPAPPPPSPPPPSSGGGPGGTEYFGFER
jgi:hypothetical protein